MEIALKKIKTEIENIPVTIGGYIKGIKFQWKKALQNIVDTSVGSQVAYRSVVATGLPFRRLIEVANEEKPRRIGWCLTSLIAHSASFTIDVLLFTRCFRLADAVALFLQGKLV